MSQIASKKPKQALAVPPEFPEQMEQDESLPVGGEMPEWVDRAIPWISSGLIHAGVFLLFLFAYQVVKTVVQKPQPIIIPQTWQSHFSRHPGGHPHPQSNRLAQQDLKKLLSKALKTSVTHTHIQSLTAPALHSTPLIAMGPGGGSSASGALAAFDVPSGSMGSVQKSSFIGSGGNATRIVYIIDHEGSMLENFGFLKSHLIKSVDKLVPLQSFAVIIFRKNYRILGSPQLIPATTRNKQNFSKLFRRVAPAGAAEYRFSYFARPFKAAFRMKPQIIYFLTSGAFNPKLINYIRQLNKTKAVHIYTYAFVMQDPSSIKNMKLIARQNGGTYKYISRQEAGE